MQNLIATTFEVVHYIALQAVHYKPLQEVHLSRYNQLTSNQKLKINIMSTYEDDEDYNPDYNEDEEYESKPPTNHV